MAKTGKSNKPETRFTIGKLAKQAGVGVETVRYYQKRGLMQQPTKPKHSHRTYSVKALARLRFIKRAQVVGFTLREIATLLALGKNHCAVARSLAEDKLRTIDEQIGSLRTTRRKLEMLIDQCSPATHGQDCGLVVALSEGENKRTKRQQKER
jgi:MerR family mercuric resistance operon transcriptional regulator